MRIGWPPWYVVVAALFLFLYFEGETELVERLYNRAMTAIEGIPD